MGNPERRAVCFHLLPNVKSLTPLSGPGKGATTILCGSLPLSSNAGSQGSHGAAIALDKGACSCSLGEIFAPLTSVEILPLATAGPGSHP